MVRSLLIAAGTGCFFVANVASAQDGSGGIWDTYRAHKKHPVVQESVPASDLPGLVPGLKVQKSDGKPMGVVTKVVTGPDGSIQKILVVSPVGNLFKLSPTAITVSNGVVTMNEDRTNS